MFLGIEFALSYTYLTAECHTFKYHTHESKRITENHLLTIQKLLSIFSFPNCFTFPILMSDAMETMESGSEALASLDWCLKQLEQLQTSRWRSQRDSQKQTLFSSIKSIRNIHISLWAGTLAIFWISDVHINGKCLQWAIILSDCILFFLFFFSGVSPGWQWTSSSRWWIRRCWISRCPGTLPDTWQRITVVSVFTEL